MTTQTDIAGTAASKAQFRKGRHLAGTESACDVLTTGVRKVNVHAHRVNELREVLLVYGRPGLGKTFALRRYLEQTDIPYIMLTLTHGAGSKEVLSRMLTLTTGTMVAGTAWELRGELRDVLAEQQRIVAIDECAGLSLGALNTLRSLHDEDSANFALYLCGSVAERVASRVPALGDRIGGTVRFTPYSEQQMMEYLAEYHEAFRSTPTSVLHYIFKEYAGGKFRAWARMLQVGLPLLSKRGQEGFDLDAAALCIQAVRLPSRRASKHLDPDANPSDLSPTPAAELVAATYGYVLTAGDGQSAYTPSST